MVSIENIYKSVLEIIGIKHPVISPEALNKCGDYILDKMTDCGLEVREHTFQIEGKGQVHRNIEGHIGDVENEAAIVFVAHYDTVYTTMGANDDATGVAAMLEIARNLAMLDKPPAAYFVAVTLEESSNPAIFEPEYKSALAHGIHNDKGQFLEFETSKLYKKIQNYGYGAYAKGQTFSDGYRDALSEIGETIPRNLRQHIEEIIPLYEGITIYDAPGKISRIGSHYWLKDALKEGKKIALNITLDEIGIHFDEPLTQRTFNGFDFYPMLVDRHKIDEEKRQANFVLVCSNIESKDQGKQFMDVCKTTDIDLRAGWVHVDLDFNGVAKHIPFGLNSDHANFWQQHIPSLFIFDSANARNPYTHSMGDDIGVINFDVVGKIVEALVKFSLEYKE